MFNNSTRKSFLSKVLKPVVSQRAFSRSAVQAFLAADNNTQISEHEKDVNPIFNDVQYQNLQSYSSTTHLRKKQEEEAAEAEWLS